MEAITTQLERNRIGISSPNPQSSTTNIPREQHAALFAVINKSRLAQGWNPVSAEDADPMIRTWAELLGQIPYQHYDELYQRAFKRRVRSATQGLQPPNLDALLLVAVWQTELADEIHAHRLAAASQQTVQNCDMCFGAGMRFKRHRFENRSGYTQCDHVDRTGWEPQK